MMGFEFYFSIRNEIMTEEQTGVVIICMKQIFKMGLGYLGKQYCEIQQLPGHVYQTLNDAIPWCCIVSLQLFLNPLIFISSICQFCYFCYIVVARSINGPETPIGNLQHESNGRQCASPISTHQGFHCKTHFQSHSHNLSAVHIIKLFFIM